MSKGKSGLEKAGSIYGLFTLMFLAIGSLGLVLYSGNFLLKDPLWKTKVTNKNVDMLNRDTMFFTLLFGLMLLAISVYGINICYTKGCSTFGFLSLMFDLN